MTNEYYAEDAARRRTRPAVTQVAAPPGVGRQPGGCRRRRRGHRGGRALDRYKPVKLQRIPGAGVLAQGSSVVAQKSGVLAKRAGIYASGECQRRQRRATTAQNKAATAQKTANAKAAATYSSREQALAQMQQTTKQQQATLKRELGEIQASSISGDGVYVVGKDIKAGTWHTNGSGDTGANDCYFATLNSTDTSNIADNNDFDGPETVDVSSAYAFQIGGPCSWVLVP